jgi:small conductance mechanosensitive channel
MEDMFQSSIDPVVDLISTWGLSVLGAIEVIEGVLDAEPRVLKEPGSLVVVGQLGDSSVNLLVRP